MDYIGLKITKNNSHKIAIFSYFIGKSVAWGDRQRRNRHITEKFCCHGREYKA